MGDLLGCWIDEVEVLTLPRIQNRANKMIESERQRPATSIEPVVNALWIGNALDDINAACLRSFALAGHRVRLHCYGAPRNVPPEVETFDASALMPKERVVYYKSNGSPALFSNFYRLKILEAGLGVYIDCDVFCLKPIPQRDYIFGYQSDVEINNAVLKLPANSDVLREALTMTNDPFYIAPWLSKKKQRQHRLRKAIGLPIHISHYQWGKLGPEAITYFLGKAGLNHHAATIDVFYPVHYGQVSLLLDPELSLSDVVTPRTLCVHLFDRMLRRRLDGGAIPEGSPLGEMMGLCGYPMK
ncbi:glycosyltransferase [Mesorhizobium atlanticum]|nr:glycosyltransferase [Mesorhizobium atlanticum]